MRSIGGKVNAASLNLRGLDAPSSVSTSDVIMISKGSGPNERALISQLPVAGVPDPLLLSDGSAPNPTYSFANDPSTGIYLAGANLGLKGGGSHWIFQTNRFSGAANSSWMTQGTPSGTVPLMGPTIFDLDTGLGQSAPDQLSLIAGGVEIARAVEAAVDQFILTPGAVYSGAASLPTLAFGDGNTGFYESSDNSFHCTVGGAKSWSVVGAGGDFSIGSGNLGFAGGGTPTLRDTGATATIPTIVPSKADLNTGIGLFGFDSLSLIAGGIEIARLVEAGATTRQLIAVGAGAAATPSLALADGDSGFYESSDDNIKVVLDGSERWHFDPSADAFLGIVAAAPGMRNIAATIQAPNIHPNAGDTNTGIGTTGNDDISLIAGGRAGITVTETSFVTTVTIGNSNSAIHKFIGNLTATQAVGPAMLDEDASSVNPTLVPDQADPDTGIGWRTTDIGVLIAGAVNVMEFGESGAAPLMGFFGGAAIAKPTGVAVTAAGIHAALVSLTLIAA